MEEKKGISLIKSFHFNFSCFCSHACSFNLYPGHYFSLDLKCFLRKSEKRFLKNDFNIAKLEHRKLQKLRKKFEGPILSISGQHHTLFGT